MEDQRNNLCFACSPSNPSLPVLIGEKLLIEAWETDSSRRLYKLSAE